MIQKKTRKKVCNRCLKNHVQLDFKQYEIIPSRTYTSLLQILEKFKSMAYVFNFRCRFIARPPVLLQKKISIDNSVRRLPLLKIVLLFLFADAIDGLHPNSAYADPFWLICSGSICIKKTFFHSGRDNLKVGSEYLDINRFCISRVFLLQRENIKKLKNRSACRCYFRK